MRDDPFTVALSPIVTCKRLINKWLLFNNAGIQIPAGSDQITIDDFDRVLDVNLRGAFVAAQVAIGHPNKNGKFLTVEIRLLPGQADFLFKQRYTAPRASR